MPLVVPIPYAMPRGTTEAGRLYQAASWMHQAPVLILPWTVLWEAACLSTGSVVWAVVGLVVALLCYLRARRMGVAVCESRMVLRYLLFRRSVPWEDAERFTLDPSRLGVTLRLHAAGGRTLVVPAGEFAAPQRKGSWLRAHGLVWRDGESDDPLRVLNALIAEHARGGLPSRSPQSSGETSPA
jgi:hypothetical protein